jgi:N-acetylmuramoyl-L-alanine amidase
MFVMRRVAPLMLIAVLLFALIGDPARAQMPTVPLVAIDPGHGGDDYGTTGQVSGRRLIEKELTLAVARQTAEHLQRAGYRATLLRPDDASAHRGLDRNGDGKVDLADDLQARVDRANEAGAAILLSIHFNGSTDRSLRGPEIYYSAARPFAAENRKLAEVMMGTLSARLKETGREVKPRGVLRDSVLGGSLFLLGPAGGRIARASNMPGVLVEGLFLTNPDDAALLADAATIQALARGYADGAAAYLGPAPKPAPKRARVVGASGAFLRPAPLLGAAPLTLLDPGAQVDLAEPAKGDEVGGSADWWRVEAKGQAGYVFAALLGPLTSAQQPTSAPAHPRPTATPAPAQRVTVKTDDGRAARLRAEPNRDAAIVGRAQPGETLDLIGSADGEAVDGQIAKWLNVRRGVDTGWVWAPLVE